MSNSDITGHPCSAICAHTTPHIRKLLAGFWPLDKWPLMLWAYNMHTINSISDAGRCALSTEWSVSVRVPAVAKTNSVVAVGDVVVVVVVAVGCCASACIRCVPTICSQALRAVAVHSGGKSTPAPQKSTLIRWPFLCTYSSYVYSPHSFDERDAPKFPNARSCTRTQSHKYCCSYANTHIHSTYTVDANRETWRFMW